MTPPDLPPRPVPRAPLTDVVPRRTLVIIALVVVLAVLAVVLAFVFDGDGDGSKASASGGGTRSTADARSSADTKEDAKDGTRTDGESSASASADSGADGTPSAGVSASGGAGAEVGDSSGKELSASPYDRSRRYFIGLPKGWKFQSSGTAGDRFTGPDGQKLLVAWTTTPKDDPVADWKNQARYMVRSQYKKIRIEAVDYRGWNAADWEFTYVEGGTKYRTIDRGFVVNDHLGFALMYTANAASWDSALRKSTWRTLAESFEPKS
jgi:hypothetical protein